MTRPTTRKLRPIAPARLARVLATAAPHAATAVSTAAALATAILGTAILGTALLAGRAAAHHGGALFDPATTVTVTGTVTEFQFVNPHVLIYVSVPGADGAPVRWGGELTSPNRLARMNTPVGWHKSLLAPGDEITMTGHPARNGAPAMDIEKIVDADGRVLIGE